MKRYYDLSHEELLKLEKKDIQNLIDLEVAYESIIPVVAPETPGYEDVSISKTEVAYSVGGHYYKSEEEAIEATKGKAYRSSYNYNGAGYEYRYLEPEDLTITKEHFYDKDEVMRLSSKLQSNNKLKEAYESKYSKYKKYLDETESIRDKVYGAIGDARTFQNDIEEATNQYNKYKKLSGGDEGVAKNFFRNTYATRTDLIEAVLGEKIEEESEVKENGI